MNRITIAKILAVVASVMGAISVYHTSFGVEPTGFASLCMYISPLLAFASYCLCGFFKALATPFSIAKWGFLIAPFPVNLAVVVLMFLLGILSIIYFPVVPVFKSAAELGC
jgi:hypothetical protein